MRTKTTPCLSPPTVLRGRAREGVRSGDSPYETPSLTLPRSTGGGRRVAALCAIAALIGFSGCTVHPPGELAERRAATDAGKTLILSSPDQGLPTLSDNPTPAELVHYALLSSAELEQRYWEWRSAIEQIPQDGTQATNLSISLSSMISKGTLSWDRTIISAGNDPMADIVLPQKLSVAAKRALENARAAGLRFHKSQLELRSKVISAYADYALTAELIRLEQSNASLLQTSVMVVEARNRAGAASQQDLLKAQNELDLSHNDISNMQSQLPALRAAVNALLSRPPSAPLAIPQSLPDSRPLSISDDELLDRASRENPELQALAREIRGKKNSIELARLQYLPDFSLSAGTDLAGLTQTILGSLTVPLLRYQAIDAAVAQAQANLRATEASRRQMRNDLAAQVVMDLSIIRDADRQLALFDQTIVPRTNQMVTLTRSAYELGQANLLDLLDSQRSLIAIERLVANLRVMREKRLVDLEALSAIRLSAS